MFTTIGEKDCLQPAESGAARLLAAVASAASGAAAAEAELETGSAFGFASDSGLVWPEQLAACEAEQPSAPAWRHSGRPDLPAMQLQRQVGTARHAVHRFTLCSPSYGLSNASPKQRLCRKPMLS